MPTIPGMMMRVIGWWLAGYTIVGFICAATNNDRWASLLAAFVLAGGIHMAVYIERRV